MKILSLFLVIGMMSCSKELIHYQITLETGNLKPSDILLKPLYEKKDNQCGALFLNGQQLTVINNFDTNQTFIKLKYKYEKNADGLFDTYTFEDVFLKQKERYILSSSINGQLPVLEIDGEKIKVLDKTTKVIKKDDGSTVYIRREIDEKGIDFTEIYTIKKTVLTKVIYDRYSFPCE